MRLARSLAKCANDLDNYGLYSAADAIDNVLMRLAQSAQPPDNKGKSPENFKKASEDLAKKVDAISSYTLIDALKSDELILESNLKETVRVCEFGPSERLKDSVALALQSLNDFITKQTKNKNQSVDQAQEEECIKTNRELGRLLIAVGDQC